MFKQTAVGIAEGIPFRDDIFDQFSPLDISGLIQWIDSKDASTFTLNGSDVEQWRDKSVEGNHVSQLTPANQPLYSGGEVVFDGNHFLEDSLTYDWNGNEFTIFTVQENDTAVNDFRGVVGNRFGAGAADWFTIGHSFSTNTFITEAHAVPINFTPSFNGSLQPAFIATFIKENPNTHTFRMNDGSETIDLSAVNIGDATNDVRIGQWFTATQRWIGKINSKVVFNRKLTASENSNMINFLASQFAITI